MNDNLIYELQGATFIAGRARQSFALSRVHQTKALEETNLRRRCEGLTISNNHLERAGRFIDISRTQIQRLQAKLEKEGL